MQFNYAIWNDLRCMHIVNIIYAEYMSFLRTLPKCSTVVTTDDLSIYHFILLSLLLFVVVVVEKEKRPSRDKTVSHEKGQQRYKQQQIHSAMPPTS